MRKLVLFMHTSLDGFVAGPNGEMDWINVDEEIFDYAGRETDKADAALYGRVTYQMMNSYWPTAGDQPAASKHDIEHSTWYNRVTKIVLSRTMQDLDLPKTKIISDNVLGEVSQLKQAEGRNILIFGSPTAVHSLMQENLIDVYWLFVNPIILGQGIPLFKDIKNKTSVKLVSSKTFSSGVVGLHYDNN